jgi:hypothetical protein
MQALLQAATAACARQGPMGQDQVRVQRRIWSLHLRCDILCTFSTTLPDHYSQASCDSGMACRHHCRPQLQPVPGRDLLYRIRSGCKGLSGSCICTVTSCAPWILVCMTMTFKPAVMLMVWPAGATTDLNCSLCQAGTYGTGSGSCAFDWTRWTCSAAFSCRF